MKVLQLETLTRLGFCVSLYLLELMHFRLDSVYLEIARTFLYLVCVLWRFESRICAYSNSFLKQERIKFLNSDQIVLNTVVTLGFKGRGDQLPDFLTTEFCVNYTLYFPSALLNSKWY